MSPEQYGMVLHAAKTCKVRVSRCAWGVLNDGVHFGVTEEKMVCPLGALILREPKVDGAMSAPRKAANMLGATMIQVASFVDGVDGLGDLRGCTQWWRAGVRMRAELGL